MDNYIKQVAKWPVLTKTEELDLAIKAKSNSDRGAFEKLINSNLRFVFQVAHIYKNRGLDFEDLVSEGNLGLLKAFEKFDPTRDIRFISYAVWWIRQSITNAIMRHGTFIKIPTGKISDMHKTRKIWNELLQELFREPTFEEIRKVNPDIENDLELLKLVTMISLDSPAGSFSGEEGIDLTLYNTLHETLEDSIDEEVDYSEFLEDFGIATSGFSEREKKILAMYYGIGYFRVHTLKEIGFDLGLTRERVRQIKTLALEKLQRKKLSRRLKEHLGKWT